MNVQIQFKCQRISVSSKGLCFQQESFVHQNVRDISHSKSPRCLHTKSTI